MTDIIKPTRRGIIKSLGILIAAPAIIRVADLMAISPLRETLRAEPGEWVTSDQTGALYVWYADGVEVQRSTSPSLILRGDMLGKNVSCGLVPALTLDRGATA